MVEIFERKCVELFGKCPLNIHDIQAANSLGYSEEDLLFEAAKKHYLKEQRKFFEALYDWKDGNKLEISCEEAKKKNSYFYNAKMIVEKRVSTITDTIVNWMSFPNNDPTICHYMGLPLDHDLCVWASQYK